MKLYAMRFGPGPRRCIIYLALKNLPYEFIDVEVYKDTSKPEYLAKNPSGKVPMLEMDDGSVILESQVIIQYLEEVYPDPPMYGQTDAERQRIDAQYVLINEFFYYLYMYSLHTHPYASHYLKRCHDIDIVAAPFSRARLNQIEALMEDRPFLAGQTPSIADISLFAMLDYIKIRFGLFMQPHQKKLLRWFERFSALPDVEPMQPPPDFYDKIFQTMGRKY
ncbi:MAG: glutathione S-transferase family protein [Pseudomonadota bacterium]